MRVCVAVLSSIVLFAVLYSSTSRFSINIKVAKTTNEEVFVDALPRPLCQPQHHIMFLKTHKCASSSVQNIFLRYGVRNNLTFALPAMGNYLGSPGRFQASLIPRQYLPPEGIVDIFAMHTRLNVEEHRKVLPKDAVFVTVVRDPVSLFESLYNYFQLSSLYDGLTLQKYLELPLQKQLSYRSVDSRFGYNMMLFDMGFDVHLNMSAAQVHKAIDEMDNLFDIVLVAEQMDESLILLKERLCWDFSDVIFFTKNARQKKYKEKMAKTTENKLRELNSGDVLLYEYFMNKHKKAVNVYGIEKMTHQVDQLRSLRDKFFKDCGTKVVSGYNTNDLFKEYSGMVDAYALDNNTDLNCLLLSMPELRLINKIREMYKQKT